MWTYFIIYVISGLMMFFGSGVISSIGGIGFFICTLMLFFAFHLYWRSYKNRRKPRIYYTESTGDWDDGACPDAPNRSCGSCGSNTVPAGHGMDSPSGHCSNCGHGYGQFPGGGYG